MNKRMNTPLVSVVVPVYNVETYIRRCVDSLLSQTLQELEIILVDDGSPDACGDILDGYAKQYANIVVVHQKNGGLSDARNAGLRIAKGRYIGFVDPDDYVEPDMFRKLYDSANTNDSDLVFCGYNEVFSPTYTEKRMFESIAKSKSVADVLTAHVQGDIGAYAWNKLFKQSLIEDHAIEFPRGVVIGEDQVFFCQYLQHARSFSVVQDCLYHYIRNDKSICAKYHNRQFEFYKIGFSALENAIRCFGDAIDPSVHTKSKVNILNRLLAVIDVQASTRNKTSLSARYKEMCALISDEEFLNLLSDYGDQLTDKSALKKVKYIRAGRTKALFVYEFFKMRIVARIKYYIG